MDKWIVPYTAQNEWCHAFMFAFHLNVTSTTIERLTCIYQTKPKRPFTRYVIFEPCQRIWRTLQVEVLYLAYQ